MDLGEGIALNEALRENLFMLLVSATWQQLPWLWCVVQLEVFFQNDVDPFFKGDIIIFKKMDVHYVYMEDVSLTA